MESRCYMMTVVMVVFFHRVEGYKFHVHVVEDDGTTEDWVYDPSPLEDRPMSRMHAIAKRSITPIENIKLAGKVLEKAHPSCVKQLSDLRSRQAQFAEIVDLGGHIKLACHFCSSTANSRKPMVWFKFEAGQDPVTGAVLWRARELELDMHDNERLNRVFVLPDHTLVILDFEPADAGSYFCEDFNKNAEKLSKFAFESKNLKTDALSAVKMGLAWKQLEGTKNIDFLYHLDMALPVRAVLVSNMPYSAKRPAKPLANEHENWIAETKWGQWSNCSTCGVTGERKRLRGCTVRRLDNKKAMSDPYLGHVFYLYPGGVPCASSLFQHHPGIKAYPHEVELGSCEAPCPTDKTEAEAGDKAIEKGVFSNVKIKSFVAKKPKIAYSNLRKVAGNAVHLYCIGSKTETAVQWRNGSTPLASVRVLAVPARAGSKGAEGAGSDGTSSDRAGSEGGGRVRIDATNILHIYNLTVSDTGVYTCSYDNYNRTKIELHVSGPPPSKEDVPTYMMYLGISYGVNFVLLLLGLGVQHLQRYKQVKQPRKNTNPEKEQLLK